MRTPRPHEPARDLSLTVSACETTLTSAGQRLLGKVRDKLGVIDLALVDGSGRIAVVRFVVKPRDSDRVALATMLAQGDFTRCASPLPNARLAKAHTNANCLESTMSERASCTDVWAVTRGSQTARMGHGGSARQISRMTGALQSCRRSHSSRSGAASPRSVVAASKVLHHTLKIPHRCRDSAGVPRLGLVLLHPLGRA